MRRVYIAVPGILSLPSDSLAWYVRILEDIMISSSEHPVGLEFRYFTGPLETGLFRDPRAEHVANLIRRWEGAGFGVVLIGHSDGCNLIVKALASAQRRIEAVHLIAAACDSSLETTGFNLALKNNILGKLHCYCSSKDVAVGFWARLASNLKGLKFGYGVMGADGPRDVSPDLRDRVVVHRDDTMSHTGWFQGSNYFRMLEWVTELEP